MGKQPLVSIIVPVYNAERYIGKCIKSITGQDIGFIHNIELILINDGSSDGSDKICQDYACQYEYNVKYYSQSNSGVSAARNKGLELASGQIIGFVDADDFLSKNAVSSIWNYFRIARDYVDIALIKVKNFGAMNAPHVSNGKFAHGTQTLDLNNPRWFDVCTRVGQAFFRAEAIREHAFDSDVTFFEDTKFINEVLVKKMRLGVVHTGIYFYRRYPNESDAATSLTVGAAKNKRFYLETPEKVSLYLLTRDYGGQVPLYYQYVALSEMRWRTFYNSVLVSHFLSSEEYSRYNELNDSILSNIDDATIMSCGLYNFWQKVHLLNMKHKRNILNEARYEKNGNLAWQDIVLFNAQQDLQANITDILITRNAAIIEGYFIGFTGGNIKLYARTADGTPLVTEVIPYSVKATIFPLEYETYRHSAFSAVITLKNRTVINFAFKIDGQESIIKKIGISAIGNPDHVHPVVQIRRGRIIRRFDNCICINKLNAKNVLELCRYFARIMKSKKSRKKVLTKVSNRIKTALGWRKNNVHR